MVNKDFQHSNTPLPPPLVLALLKESGFHPLFLFSELTFMVNCFNLLRRENVLP